MRKIDGMDVKRKLYVIDGENCFGSKLHSKLTRASNADVVVVIGRGQNIKECNKRKVEIIEAQSGQKNAIDFVVIAVALDRLSNGYRQIVIVTNDKGYDSAIDYLRGQDYNIIRQTSDLKNSRVYPDKKKDSKFKSMCGFIANNMNNGITEHKLIQNIKARTHINYLDYVNILDKYAYITRSKRKIYFNREELSNIAKNRLRIGERMKDE